MADSDNSISLHFVTCERKRDFTPAASGMPVESPNIPGDETPDPVIALTERWRDAHARTLALCRHQQRLETRISRKFGFPSKDLPQFKRWKQADLELGYSKAKRAEERSAQTAERLLEQLARTPAQSLDGVIAKLDVILLEGGVSSSPLRFPWPQLRSALADLKRCAATQPPS